MPSKKQAQPEGLPNPKWHRFAKGLLQLAACGVPDVPVAPLPQQMSWRDCPSDVLLNIFRFLDLPGKAAAESVSPSWRSVLANPTVAIWGQVDMSIEQLVHMLPSRKEGYTQTLLLRHLDPVCRWVMQRAPGMTCLVIDSLGTVDAPNEDLDLARQIMQLLLPTLAALLGPTDLEIKLNLHHGCHLTGLLASPALTQKLSTLITELDVLHPLNAAEAALLGPLKQVRHAALVLPAVNQEVVAHLALLSGLESLQLSLLGQAGVIALPGPALSALQKLSSLQLVGRFPGECPPSLALLPQLQDLVMKAEPATYNRSLFVNSALAALTTLTSLHLENAGLGGGLTALGSLTLLQTFTARCVQLQADDGSEGDLFWASIGSMTALTRLELIEMFNCPTPEASSLQLLGRLSIIRLNARLASFECCTEWEALRCLDLRHNVLPGLPANLAALTGLTRLDLSFQLADFQITGPMHFINGMPNLSFINLQQVHLQLMSGSEDDSDDTEWEASEGDDEDDDSEEWFEEGASAAPAPTTTAAGGGQMPGANIVGGGNPMGQQPQQQVIETVLLHEWSSEALFCLTEAAQIIKRSARPISFTF